MPTTNALVWLFTRRNRFDFSVGSFHFFFQNKLVSPFLLTLALNSSCFIYWTSMDDVDVNDNQSFMLTFGPWETFIIFVFIIYTFFQIWKKERCKFSDLDTPFVTIKFHFIYPTSTDIINKCTLKIDKKKRKERGTFKCSFFYHLFIVNMKLVAYWKCSAKNCKLKSVIKWLEALKRDTIAQTQYIIESK